MSNLFEMMLFLRLELLKTKSIPHGFKSGSHYAFTHLFHLEMFYFTQAYLRLINSNVCSAAA